MHLRVPSMLLAAVMACAALPRPAAGQEPMTMRQAVTKALEQSPRLAAFDWDLRAADARALQASLRPNPRVSVEVEDINLSGSIESETNALSVEAGAGGAGPVGVEFDEVTGAPSGFDEAQITLSIAKVFELGGKRLKRVDLEERRKDVVAWDYESTRADVIAETARAFLRTVAAEQRLALRDELVELAQEVVRTASLRVEAGKVSPLQVERAQINLTEAEIDRNAARRTLDGARARLAASWGGQTPYTGPLDANLEAVEPVPPREDFAEDLGTNPDVARWSAEIAARRAHRDLERARAIPDPEVSAGFRMKAHEGARSRSFGLNSAGRGSAVFRESDPDRDWSNSLVVEVGIPIPVFDRNQGTIAEVDARIGKAGEQERSAVLAAYRRIADAHARAAAAYDEATSLEKTVIPAATTTFEKTERGYRQGKFSYLDVLDAQQTLFRVREDRMDALERYHAARIDLERYTGRSLSDYARSEASGPEEAPK